MADRLAEGVAGAVDRAERGGRAPARSFVADGPPLLLVAVIFAGLLSLWLAPGAPALLAVLLGAALLLSLALEFRRWGLHVLVEGSSIELDPISLRQRLDAARARRIERARWR